jgi:23S rRNA (guanine1835-N2)-methyltransferase
VIVRAGDGLAGQEPLSLDVVLCNPPFHQQQVVGDFLAWRMFQQAREALVVGGALYIVGNRHLGYHSKLARIVPRCRASSGHAEVRDSQGP